MKEERYASKKLMLHDFCNLKAAGQKICWLTAYNFPTAQNLHPA
jgi:hypothetical protein